MGALGTPEPTVRSGRSGLFDAVRYALSGISYAVRTQRNLRIEFGFAILALALSAILEVSRVEAFLVLTLIGCVLAAEMVNTSVEAMIDLASPDPSPLAKVAKDTAAGAVLVLAAVSLSIGIAMFLPRLVAKVVG